MKNNGFAFRHTTEVFGFTLRAAMKGKAFIVMTFVMPLILAIAFFMISFFPSLEKEEETVTKKIYLIDETGQVAQYFKETYDHDRYKLDVKVMEGKTLEEVCEGISREEVDSFVIDIISDGSESRPKYSIKAVIPGWSNVPENEYNELISSASYCVSVVKVYSSDVAVEKLSYLMSSTYSNVVKAGEESTNAVDVILKMLVPMLYSLIMYVMIFLYGQSIGRSVVEEKNSRLMEMVLTCIHPEALIAGKVLAMNVVAMLQIMLWVIGGAVGFFAGDVVAKSMTPDYVNASMETLKAFAEGSSAFSPAAIVISVLATLIGFSVFSFIAAFVAAGIGKPEELANSMGMFNLFTITGYLVTYLLSAREARGTYILISLVPITSPFTLGAQVLVGNVSILIGALGLAVMVIACVVLAVFAAIRYRNKVFYTGSGKLTKIFSFLK